MLKDKLELLVKEFTTLKEKITTKLQQKDNTITETNTKLQASKNEVADKAEEINDSYLSHLQFAYFNAVNAFLALTRGWWEEKNAGGPTIEEISD